mmetsp:Transcript_10052/g.16254  ORF Transcript_10052/g.16254 Transcript_10052/m.16254 type:complete len:246 (+) Transcript_10052:1094-1831(+)
MWHVEVPAISTMLSSTARRASSGSSLPRWAANAAARHPSPPACASIRPTPTAVPGASPSSAAARAPTPPSTAAPTSLKSAPIFASGSGASPTASQKEGSHRGRPGSEVVSRAHLQPVVQTERTSRHPVARYARKSPRSSSLAAPSKAAGSRRFSHSSFGTSCSGEMVPPTQRKAGWPVALISSASAVARWSSHMITFSQNSVWLSLSGLTLKGRSSSPRTTREQVASKPMPRTFSWATFASAMAF